MKGEKPMQYLLLIYGEEKTWDSLPDAERNKLMADFGSFTKSIVETKQFQGGNQLHPVSAATTVRVRQGKTLTTHGPFAETREQLGGYYLIEAKDLDEATAIASRIPSAKIGSIEVRPVVPMTSM
jgi:hypothetical protein